MTGSEGLGLEPLAGPEIVASGCDESTVEGRDASTDVEPRVQHPSSGRMGSKAITEADAAVFNSTHYGTRR